MKKIIVLLLVVAFPLAAQQFGQVGTSGAQLFKINLDPRASALGYAAASVVGNASAIYTNVAGLEGIANGDVAFAYAPWFADLHLMSVAAAYRLPEIGVIGVQAGGFSAEEEITTIDQENGTGQMYKIQNYVFGVGFSRMITDRLAVGVQAKYVYESYYEHSTGGVAFDLGSNYDLGFNGARLALAVQNFGPDVQPLSGGYADYSDSDLRKSFSQVPLPVTFRASFSIEPFTATDYRFRIIADLVHPNDNTEHYNIGGEVVAMEMIAFRGGLKLNYDDETFAAGVGLNGQKLLGQNIRLDYSYEHFTILPSVHKVAVGFSL